ncbi:hypothetical protein [Pseudemcibacter aquimaris]|uniref:hypothetical protein n=1 Tax=Pseudemcibacter aquimaris TaxID=2857064 RepID=UPI002012D0B2|nr:hypothetical protein [Pseudemcibacter aquimaris]MCC3859941.1 hypothetical protein [Pseudemcibacter aquimaris]WDU57273.1 hypothetical protein KW060_08685 [Pseudemcibacter aquimaris]
MNYLAKSFKLLTSTIILLLGVNHANAERAIISHDRKADGFWKTERAKFLDDPIFNDKLLEAASNTSSKNEISTPQEASAKITQLILAELSSEKGVHIETALATLGALSGFSCQMAIREAFVKSGKISLDDAFVVVETNSNEKFYMGPLLNECIVSNKQGQHSVWGFIGGAVQSLEKPLPELEPIFARTSATIGGDEFAKFEVADKNQPHFPSEELLWKYWNITRNILMVNDQDPMFWPFILGISTQQIILQGKNAIDPSLAAKIAMEAAIPMSKIDPQRIHAASLE